MFKDYKNKKDSKLRQKNYNNENIKKLVQEMNLLDPTLVPSAQIDISTFFDDENEVETTIMLFGGDVFR